MIKFILLLPALALLGSSLSVVSVEEKTEDHQIYTRRYKIPTPKEYALSKAQGQEYYLDYIIVNESNYDPTIKNPTSSAGGLPQALPWTKMGCELTWQWKDYKCQIDWMLDEYIPGRYGNIFNAYLFKLERGYY